MTMTRRRSQSGFTLMEVMIALAILAGGLALSLAATASNVRQAHRAQALGNATALARSKMYDIEEELIQEGYQELEQTMDGDFSDEGWPDITWEATVEKIELPGLASLQAADAAEGGDGTGASTGALGDGQGGEAGGIAGMAGAGLIGSQFETIANVLERSIRRVTLKVTWKVGRAEEDMTIVCYFTNRQGVDEAMSGAPPADDAGDGGGGADDGGGTQRQTVPRPGGGSLR
jgi:general secretion pathway protein I